MLKTPKSSNGIFVCRTFRLTLILIFSAFIFPTSSLAQADYPPTVWIPVTFYDFHSDGSCPEFEQPHIGGVRTGMVADTLDKDFKPVPGPSPYMNYYIKYWFRPWENSAKGDFTIPRYDTRGNFLGIATVNHDTAFKNIVIRDSLLFRHVGGGTYEFDRSEAAGQFFGIDGRGFGNEGKQHNYSFTMHLYTKFTYKRGQTFNFLGDDDVWVFINGKLAMDLGGIHTPAPNTFNLDQINISKNLGLIEGQEYDLHLFYAERHTVMSTIRIITNLIQPKPAKLKIVAPDSVKAGQPAQLQAKIWDNRDTLRPDYAAQTRWELLNLCTREGDVLSNPVGEFTTLSGTRAYRYACVVAWYNDPTSGQTLRDTARIKVVPGDPCKVVIEADTIITPMEDTVPIPVDLITMSERDVKDTTFATVRDCFGNFIRLAYNAIWQSLNPDVANVSAEAGRNHMGIISRVAFGTAYIRALETGLTPDTVKVVMRPGVLDSIRIVNAQGIPIESITMLRTDDTTLYVQGKYSTDLANWVPITALWTLTPDVVKIDPPFPPNKVNWWTIVPQTPGCGQITVTEEGKTKSIPVCFTDVPAKLTAAVTKDINGNGYLDRIVLYFDKPVSFPTDPNEYKDYLASISIVYGVPETRFTVASLEFDPGSGGKIVWLNLHENQNNVPQTAWTPTVTLTVAPGNGQPSQIMAIDGAGPVVWQVTRYILNMDPRKDRIVIQFSENIFDTNQNIINVGTLPASVFGVYSTQREPTFLNAVTGFTFTGDYIKGSDKFEFYMDTTSPELTAHYFININTDPQSAPIADKAGNVVNTNNQQVRVKVVGPPPDKITAIPSPYGIPSGRPHLSPDGKFTLKDYRQARNEVINNPTNSWIILTFRIPVPDNDKDKYTGVLKIYDVAGNLVAWCENTTDIFNPEIRDNFRGSIFDYDIPWNGTNQKGMKVAPGVYRAVLHLKSETLQPRRLVGTFGVGR